MNVLHQRNALGNQPVIWEMGNEAVLRYPSRTLSELLRASNGAPAELAQAAWEDGDFRNALLLASPHLHRRIREFQGNAFADDDLARAVCRYIVRMSSRPTPFGAFAGVSYVSTSSTELISLPGRDDLSPLIQPNSEFLEWLADQLSSKRYSPAFPVSTNDTLTLDQGAFRFYIVSRDRKGRKNYAITEIEADEILSAVVEFSMRGRWRTELIDFIVGRSDASVTTSDADSYVDELLRSQILCLDGLHDLTSDAPLLHMAKLAHADSGLHDTLLELHHCYETKDVDDCERRASSVIAAMGLPPSPYPFCKLTLIDERETAGGIEAGIRNEVLSQLPRFVAETQQTSPLRQFIKNFELRFGDTAVPLPEVLKSLPFLGFAQGRRSPVLAIGGKRSATLTAGAGKFNLAGLLSSGNMRWCYLKPTPPPLPAAYTSSQNVPLVAWLSLWDSADSDQKTVDAYVEVKSVGRQEPGRVMGRFAHGLAGLRSVLTAHDAGDSDSSPIVAEIVYKPAMKAMNVVARVRLSDWELRIRSGSRSQSDRQLGIDDLLVSVGRERVLLHHKGTGRLVLLRMSNAHAFATHGSLPTYIFLNAVSNQDAPVRVDTPRDLYPTEEVLPGIIVGKLILARPSWVPTAAFRASLVGLPLASAVQKLRLRAGELGLPDWLSIAQGDNVLPLRLSCDWMAEEIVRLLRGNSRVEIHDVFPEGLQPVLASPQGRCFHELQVVLRRPGGGLRLGQTPRMPVPFSRDVLISPRSHWKFFKIYCPASSQNSVLGALTHALAGCAEPYFFVRYKDALGEHLRFRVGAQRGEQGLGGFEDELDRLWQAGEVDTYVIAPYHRELDRYGGPRSMDFIERIFCLDSRIIVDSMLDLSDSKMFEWMRMAANFDAYLFITGITEPLGRLKFAQRAASDYAHEFAFSVDDNRQIGMIHRKSRKELESRWPLLVRSAREKYAGISSDWQAALASMSESANLYDVRWSLIHMHANRCFRYDARRQEAVVWELLKRTYMAESGRARAGAAA